MQFGSYNIKKELLNIINSLGYVEATPIQENVIPKILKGKSLLCKAETGSGKTHAFLIPLINNIDLNVNEVQVVIISPTVELSMQTYEFAKEICSKLENIDVRLASSNSSKEENEQSINSIDKPCILIGTPGRLKSVLITNKQTSIKYIQSVVLDECDMLLDDAYLPDVNALLQEINPAQRLAFTATMKEHLISWTKRSLKIEEIIDVNKKDKVNANVSHHFIDIKHTDPIEALVHFLEIKKPYLTMVFASQKTQVEKVHNELNKLGISNALITGNLETRERKITMRRIQNGEFNLIVCSDIASRGIDIENVTCVVSIDLPTDFDYYYHRAGRTGRNEKTGDSYVFYNIEDKKKMDQLIEKSKLSFDYYSLNKEGLKKKDTATGNKKKKEVNEKLEKEIKIAAAKARTKKVKPCYKKKVKNAVEKAKWFHKRQIMKANLRVQAKEKGDNIFSKK